ncbi:OSM3-like kinesin [Angomonas deanei]|uniref:Microtubule binding/Kinesin motor domain containing protein, putative n=1 Tax=Angomonas deanei TaxID=59799 RepID=A0A7G2C971_9TRYP|nr:OSM3-like kinesin [Angomonas deanei]CAD2216380.1 Microtubule binding/Kinesin motor domain containing protein, putative [Angomonas deanei]|eukprot:EPY27622.1 OSM3-like kinesin [Angomonas deanei]
MKKKNSGSENIRVVIRTRDLLPYEAERGDKALVRLDLATNQVIVQHPIGDPDVFAFDAVYNNTFTQRDIFLQEVQPLADAVLQGYNATVFAYGQSGSGKTHTMTGKLSDREMWGMMPQVVDYLFSEIKKQTSSTKTFKVRVSYVELYNGKSRDLLASKQVNLEIKQNMQKNFYVKGADMPEVTSFDEAIKWFNAGTDRRQTASTDLNDTSSRSHSLFTVQIEQLDFENDPSQPIVMTSKINVVDLAGSEKLSKTNATGETAKEGCNINLSLSALATVIDTIVKGGKHIPYRGSPLTMLLKDSLGGNAKTVMFANVGPSDKNTSETISTLRFALRAKQIENKPLKNMDPKDARIQDLMDQIEELKKRLGNVDLNVEEELRQRVEELEVENTDLRAGGADKNNLELEDECRRLQADIDAKGKEIAEIQKEIQKEKENAHLASSNYAFESSRLADLKTMNINFIKRVCSDDQVAKIKSQMPKDGSYNLSDDKWDVKEIGFYLKGFSELYEHMRKVTYTQEDMEQYAKKAMSSLQEQAQRQVDEAVRARDDAVRQKDEEANRRKADNESISQLKVDLNMLREENTKLREKVERDQEKIKAKLAKNKEEYKAVQDELENTKALITEKERDIERMKRMIEDGQHTGVGGGILSTGGADGGATDPAIKKQLDEERMARANLERKIKETNVSLRRFGVCISDPNDLENAKENASNEMQAFVLAAADEEPLDGDLFGQLQQQVRTKQRLVELAHQQQTRLDDLVRKYELLKTGQVTSLVSGGVAPVGVPEGVSGGAVDSATAQQVKELLQRKEDEIDRIQKEKDQTCDKLVKKLNKCERKISDLESTLSEERAQFKEERDTLVQESAELRKYIQELSVEVENTRALLNNAKDEAGSLERSKDKEIEYLKSEVDTLNKRINDTRNKAAEFEEVQKSYARLQQQLARTEAALSEKAAAVDQSREMAKWSTTQLENEKKRTEEMEVQLREKELELRHQEETWRKELADQVNKVVINNNRRLEAQNAQFQELLDEEQLKQKSLQKKVKTAKANAAKAAQTV